MKKLTTSIMAILLIGIVVGCISAPQIPVDLCIQYDQEKSVLLNISEAKQIPLNEIYYGLIDITAMAMISKVVGKEEVQKYMNNIAVWYVNNHPVSYMSLINYMSDQEEAMQLAGILARRIGAFKSHLFISQYDNCLLMAGWNEAMDQLFLQKEIE